MSQQSVNFELEMSPVGLGLQKISQIVDYDDFTDGGATTGSLDLTDTIPAGSIIIGAKANVKTGFTGDTTATLKIGITGTDDDGISGGSTINVLAASDNLMASCLQAVSARSAATTVTLIVTGGADFTSISAGRMLVEVFYFSTNVETAKGYAQEFQL